MRSRLLGIVLALVVLLLVGLGLPLGRGIAAAAQQELFLDRLTDTNRFASLAQRPLVDGQPSAITEELRRYQEVYGIRVALVDQDRRVLASSADVQVSGDVSARVDVALAGREPTEPDLVLPWDDTELVLAEPVLVDGDVRGAVVTLSPTGKTRRAVVFWWLVLLAGSLLALAVAVFAALPLVRWTLRPVRALDDATGTLLAAVVSGRPVPPVDSSSGPPELRQLARSFDQMAANVSDVLAAQRAFVADASHQLRNPLTALRLRLSNLDGQVSGDALTHQVAALDEADRLNRILDELLALARAGAASVDPVPVDVDRAVADRLSAWQPAAAARGVHLVLDGEPGGTVLAPPRGVEAVLDALLDNALKFTRDDTLVHVDVRRTGQTVVLSVRDEGPGLAPDDLERAFDRFWRAPEHQNVRGSGLGLALVRQIVGRVDGTVHLEAPDPGGLRVVVELPGVRP
ncbi:HAMP domain-containing sensor histidine kinase [Saccharothrix violaceirubra]|uniref:histidine kinase n=1 Tax=Saccharothrix violaceirubra TaxID=413306 RepID=A0A7W7WYF4_9PSEU|nr:HAMP domain-containing sensor histidine kinase [Saccharothrix violaceirubra]MBB4967653.1 signal transduction histidine kinase [Saccharothrix violaceirubra]